MGAVARGQGAAGRDGAEGGMSADAIPIPGPLFRQFQEQVGAEFLEELERAILADELTDEDVQALADAAGLTRAAA